MTKSNFAPSTSRSPRTIDPANLPQIEHAQFQTANEDELQDTAVSDNDNGGGSAGTHGNGSGG